MKRGKRHILAVPAVFLLTALLAAPVLAQDDITWVTVEGRAAMERKSKDEARSVALEDALRRAREKVVVSSISVESLAVNFKLSGGIAALVPYLKVVDKTVLDEGLTNQATDGSATSSPTYRVLVKAGLVEESAGADPAFKLESSLNRASFVEGDEMKIRIKSTRDCYVSVFLILGDGKVLRLLPNRFTGTVFLKAGEAFSFPDEKDKRKGISLVVSMPDNPAASNESIYVLALKQPFSSDTAGLQEGIYGVYNGNTAFMNDLVKDIAGIPLRDRAEKLLQYQIRGNKGGAR
jgi:uncharacterized protein DUF4384